MTKKLEKTIPDHEYRVTFGVKQAEIINKAANIVNETPRDFLSNSALDAAKALVDGDNTSNS
ncbi:hypothetical protein ACHHY8_21775 [Enterobacter cloacae complex sp. 2024EL-00215]|uniref:hypothetical protein n=1 Tax=Enterobacterales TaxID=91347 RepID=UPI000D4821B7|nr:MULTISPECIES: hypothetical protein [Pectobacterium]POD90679.1 hypothetical protein BV925_16885 [Pectobacterium odoriferum]HCT5765283.1 hypothetical protein [Klebsiella variicola]HDG9833886.1 hypothetical protein [Raoultella ornithinolytica]HDZ2201567.1 hypothetical protein [Klebsiella pneumoniae]